MKNRIFLIGGYDLEMVEILKLLKSNNCIYYDKKLTWGAKLTDYIEYFNEADTFYGIELDISGCKIPKYYYEIDHHGENSHRTSSIEQIGELLGVKLDRWQRLVAVNDVGYIPGLIKAGATPEEIKEIRYRDRKAQGVTQLDENLAATALNTKEVINGITIVFSESERFSPICDNLYPVEKLLIYSKYSLNYYGKNKNIVINTYKNSLIKEGKAYYGGDENNGFFGIKYKALDFTQLLKIKEEIIYVGAKREA